MSRKQIAYLNLSNTTEKNLVDATELVINAYNQYDLPRFWGPGNTASVDGTRFDLYEQNLLSEYHVRYASYGGVGYYLVSDTYIALFSRFIPVRGTGSCTPDRRSDGERLRHPADPDPWRHPCPEYRGVRPRAPPRHPADTGASRTSTR